jgi:hypothetical protein
VAPGAAGAGLSTSAGRAGLAMGTTAADGDLPSAMTCANYIKLPPYSCRPVLRERLLYACAEGVAIDADWAVRDAEDELRAAGGSANPDVRPGAHTHGHACSSFAPPSDV